MEKEQKSRHMRIAVLVLSVLLALSLLALGAVLIYGRANRRESVQAVAPDNVIASDTQETATQPVSNTPAVRNTPAPTQTPRSSATNAEPKPAEIALYRGHAADNLPFRAVDLFPGDVLQQKYCVRVSHEDAVKLHFRAEIQPGGELLAEVLMVHIVLGGETLYDGLMRDMPVSLTHNLSAAAPTHTDVRYDITVYLETSVGNRHMNAELLADFNWWVEDTGSLIPPKTGDEANPLLWICLGTSAVAALVLLLIIQRRRARHGE